MKMWVIQKKVNNKWVDEKINIPNEKTADEWIQMLSRRDINIEFQKIYRLEKNGGDYRFKIRD